MISHRVSGQACPNCMKLLDAMTNMSSNEAPINGQVVTVCIYCAAILEVNKKGNLIPFQSMDKLDAETKYTLYRTQQIVKQYIYTSKRIKYKRGDEIK